MDNEPIVLDNLSIGYGKKTVASNLSLSIRQGELTCLLGANGAGKSTLLRTLCGFQPKLDGCITIMGRQIEDMDNKELSHLVSVVLTDKPDTLNLSVRQLVALGRAPYTGFWGKCNDSDMAIVDEALSMVGINTLSERMIGTLSDGERQKTMIAKALAQQTPIIFLDEPTAFLDYPSKVDTLMLLKRICKKTEKTVFLSTHDVELALQIADRIWLMGDKGIATGTPKQLADSGQLQDFFDSDSLMFDEKNGIFKVI